MKNCKPVDKHFIIKQHMVTYPISANGIIALAKLTTFNIIFQIETNQKIRQRHCYTIQNPTLSKLDSRF